MQYDLNANVSGRRIAGLLRCYHEDIKRLLQPISKENQNLKSLIQASKPEVNKIQDISPTITKKVENVNQNIIQIQVNVRNNNLTGTLNVPITVTDQKTSKSSPITDPASESLLRIRAEQSSSLKLIRFLKGIFMNIDHNRCIHYDFGTYITYIHDLG